MRVAQVKIKTGNGLPMKYISLLLTFQAMRRSLLFFFAFFLTIAFCVAQQLEVLSAPSKAFTEDYFELQYRVSTAEIDRFIAPDLKDFYVHSGPNVSTANNYTSTNGKVSTFSSTTYTFILQPRKQGRFKIPAAAVVVKGKTLLSKTIAIEVVSGKDKVKKSRSDASNRKSSASAAQQPRNIGKKDLWIKATASRTRVYEQEAVLLTYRYYARQGVRVHQVSIIKKPEIRDVVSHETSIESSQMMPERINGILYASGIVGQYLIFPQKKGTLTIPAITFDCALVQEQEVGDMLELFFNGANFVGSHVKRQSNALKIEVAALPTPSPASFSGGVGTFAAKGELLNKDIRTNEIATYRLTITGTGNLKLLTAPKIAYPKDFEVLEPKLEEKVESTENGMQGSIVFDYTFIPKNIGSYTLSPVPFTFFNAQENRYHTIELPALTMEVRQGKAVQETASATLHPLREGLRGKQWIEWGTVTYWLLYIAFGLIAIGIMLYLTQWNNAKKETKKQAFQKARKTLKRAELLLRQSEEKEAYRTIKIALSDYVVDKFDLSHTELSKSKIASVLTAASLTMEQQQSFLHLLETCEAAQYAPTAPQSAPHLIVQEAKAVLTSIEKRKSL